MNRRILTAVLILVSLSFIVSPCYAWDTFPIARIVDPIPQYICVGDAASFDGVGSAPAQTGSYDPDNGTPYGGGKGIDIYGWWYGYGNWDYSSGGKPSHTYDTAGVYYVHLYVYDDDLGTQSQYWDTCMVYVVEVVDVTSSKDVACLGENVTFGAITNPLNMAHLVTVTWSGGENPATGSGSSFMTNWSTPGTKTVTSTCGTSSAQKNVTVVEVDRIQYKIGGDAYQDAPSTLVVAKGADVTFKAIKNPSSAQWPAGKPVWSGSSGASGTGEEKEVAFDTASSSPTDYKVVEVECGNTVSVNVVVVDLSALEINANRTSAPSETSFLVKTGEHIELNGTFRFDLMLNTWPTPVKLDAEIWDMDYINEVIASGSGASISHTFGTGEHDDGTCDVCFYFDNNTSGDSYTGWNDPQVDSYDFEAQALTYHYLTFGKSSAVAGTPGTSAACSAATYLILRKDTADDYRATARFLAAGLSTIPASTHDPMRMQRVPGELLDTWFHWSYFINYDSAEVVIVSDVIPCDANGNQVYPDTAGFSETGIKYKICLEQGDVNGGTLAHEVGHSCDLGHNNANVDNVMYESTAGNETLLTQSEAAAFE